MITQLLAPRATGSVQDALVRVSVLASIGVVGHAAFAVAPGASDVFLAVHFVMGLLHASLVMGCRAAQTERTAAALGHAVLLVNNLGMAVAFTVDGPGSGTLFFLPLNAAFALLQFGRRGGLFWTLVSAGMVALYEAGGLPIDLVAPPQLGHDPLVEQVLALVLMGAVAFMFRRALERRIEELDDARSEALEAAAARDRFLATLTHELRTPLVGALGTARLLIDEAPAPDVAQDLQAIEAKGTRLQTLLDELLEQAASRGRAELRPRAAPRAPLQVPRTLRVLVVEDNPTNAAVTHGMLTNLGHDPMVVSTGQAALESLAIRRFDVVLLDLRLPDLSGYEVFAAMSPGPRVVALTASTDERDQVLEAGMHAFLAKPCRLEELESALVG